MCHKDITRGISDCRRVASLSRNTAFLAAQQSQPSPAALRTGVASLPAAAASFLKGLHFLHLEVLSRVFFMPLRLLA